jgi:hypothetical protein
LPQRAHQGLKEDFGLFAKQGQVADIMCPWRYEVIREGRLRVQKRLSIRMQSTGSKLSFIIALCFLR